ncbi:DoxX family protein [Paracoccus kondratievae]|uniref:DoxX family protein n=1 Tax=Paracoccus kondratievae TaxID=135740 RepID=A0AAD3NZ55_9RHOB|nr:DoxX family protein [Paracoccus kondratievae]GLK65246.1 hypothetical protein GCM10017635_27200 [Paracoccus kondratievae]
MNTTRHRAAAGLGLLLAAFFLFGAWGNLFLSAENEAAYARWGYPGWFHYLTAALELSAALLILYSPSRIYGAALGACVMAAAALTTLGHGEYAHGVAPLVVLAVALILLALSWPQKT